MQVVVLRGQLLVMGGQLKEMQKSSADTSKLAEAASKQAESSANSATAAADNATSTLQIARSAGSSVETMRENLRLEERAWVGPLSAVVQGNFKIGNKTQVVLRIANTGKTPAIVTDAPIVLRPVPNGEDVKFFLPKSVAERALLLPGMVEEKKVGPLDSAPLLQDLKDGTRVLHVWGEIRYEDMFGRKHRTGFCFFFGDDLATHPCASYAYAD